MRSIAEIERKIIDALRPDPRFIANDDDYITAIGQDMHFTWPFTRGTDEEIAEVVREIQRAAPPYYYSLYDVWEYVNEDGVTDRAAHFHLGWRVPKPPHIQRA
jgi:hypothetical protein